MQIKKTTFAILLIILIPFIIGVSSAIGYNVSGYAFNSSGFVLDGVLVKAMDTENTAITNSSGYYIVSDLSNGTYTFSYNKTGYDTGYNSIIVNGEDTINANITLSKSVTPIPSSTPAAEFIPPSPVLVNPDGAAKPGSFWINYTWRAGDGYVTDSYNISVNGIWKNGTEDTYSNIYAGPHGWSNISVWAYNNSGSGRLSLTSAIKSLQVPNNNPTLIISPDSYSLNEGDTLYIKPEYYDADGDKEFFGTNATRGEFNTSTGVLSWKTGAGDSGTYNWYINVTDGYGGTASQIFTVTVNSFIPGIPINLIGTPSNSTFWVNYTWSTGANTDSFNVSVNGNWDNGSAAPFRNVKSSPHGWVNISVAGYNATSQLLSEFVSQNTQIPNNPITLRNVSGLYSLNVGDKLYIKAEYTDADNDTGTFSTTATKGTFNTSTGILTWTPAAREGGVYNWQISVTDGYGSTSTQQIKVIVPLNYNVKFIEPGIINNNGTWIETWGEAKAGHVGKLIGIDGYFNNTGEDSLTLTITDSPSIYCRDKTCTVELSKGQGMSFMQAFSERWAFELNSTEVNWIDQTHGFFNYTLKISVIGHSGSTPTFNYDNITTISLPLYPIYKMKRSSGDIAAVIAGGTTTITYTLEANSSINLTNVSIYDPFYPQYQKGPYFNISKLEANIPQNISYTYPATTGDISKFKCEGGYQCIINIATLTGRTESGELINDTDLVRIFQVQLKPASIESSGSSGSGGGGGGGSPASNEDFNNIERREVREMDIFAKSASNYVFKDTDPVMVVAFESSTSESGVPVAVEVLKNRSKYIGDDAPGKLYKYFNVFVGMSGFSKKVSNGVIVFRVNNTWLEDNDIDPKDISLYKWNGEWVEKSTEIAEKKPNYTYFASYVGNFSSFAVAGVKKPNNSLASSTSNPMMQNELANNTNSTNQTLSNSNSNSSFGSGKGKLPGALAMLPALILMAGIATGYYLRKNRNRNGNKNINNNSINKEIIYAYGTKESGSFISDGASVAPDSGSQGEFREFRMDQP